MKHPVKPYTIYPYHSKYKDSYYIMDAQSNFFIPNGVCFRCNKHIYIEIEVIREPEKCKRSSKKCCVICNEILVGKIWTGLYNKNNMTLEYLYVSKLTM